MLTKLSTANWIAVGSFLSGFAGLMNTQPTFRAMLTVPFVSAVIGLVAGFIVALNSDRPRQDFGGRAGDPVIDSQGNIHPKGNDQ